MLTDKFINIIDSPMSSGKTNAIIRKINSEPDKKILVITPYRKEIKRICQETRCVEPQGNEDLSGTTKIKSIGELFCRGLSICCTHQLFKSFNQDTMDMCIFFGKYTLIVDEELTYLIEDKTGSKRKIDHAKGIIAQFSRDDFSLMIQSGYVQYDEETGQITRNNDSSYTGIFKFIDPLFRNYDLFSINKKAIIGVFRSTIWSCFESIWLCTYMFDSSITASYFRMNGYSFIYWHIVNNVLIKGKPSNFQYPPNLDLLHICENEKYNAVGIANNALSKSWFEKNCKDKAVMKLLKNSTRNFLRSANASAKNTIWTTFSEYEKIARPPNYKTSFIACNLKATNEYIGCFAIAYLCNRYSNPNIVNFLSKKGLDFEQRKYALSELVQFIWRSAIRIGRPVEVFIPSSRMRNILKEWIMSSKLVEKINQNREIVA